MQQIDLSTKAHQPVRATLDESGAVAEFGQPDATEDESSFELPPPDLAHRLGLIAVQRAVRRRRPRQMD